jgi:hypothetical protein
MGDEEDDQETPFQELDGPPNWLKRWLGLFLREASKRGCRIEDIVGFCLPEGQSQIRSKNT